MKQITNEPEVRFFQKLKNKMRVGKRKEDDSFKVIVDRDSVCMGDDIDAHTQKFEFSQSYVTYEDLFYVLRESGYFPCVSGNNVVWVLTNKRCECIFSYFTRTDKLSMALLEKDMRKICEDSHKVLLKYYTCPEKWKLKIQEMQHWNEDLVWKKSWIEEQEYCDYVTSLGYQR